MFDKTLLTEETRKNAKEILSACKGAFRTAHAIYGYDFTKTFEVIKGTDTFTYRSIVKQIRQKYRLDDCNAIIYMNMYRRGKVYFVFVDNSNNGFQISTSGNRNYSERYIMPNSNGEMPNHFWTKSDFEEARRHDDYEYYILIQPKTEQADVSCAFIRAINQGYSRLDFLNHSNIMFYTTDYEITIRKDSTIKAGELRYKATRKDKNTYMIDGYPLFAKKNSRDIDNEKLYNNIDKSGYIKSFVHNDYRNRANALKELKNKAKADSYDYTAEMDGVKSRLSPMVTSCNDTLKHYYDVILKLTSSEIVNEYAWSKSISFPVKMEKALKEYARLRINLKEKIFSNPVSIKSAFSDINKILDEIETEIHSVTTWIDRVSE